MTLYILISFGSTSHSRASDREKRMKSFFLFLCLVVLWTVSDSSGKYPQSQLRVVVDPYINLTVYKRPALRYTNSLTYIQGEFSYHVIK